jgi:glycosyltransferase involved in cell wall biosynthesis
VIDELSIIIPTLNEENYLPRLLQSIIKQDYQGKIEIIIVDGGSKDNTLKVANEFKEKIKDLIIVSTPKSTSHQRNAGAKIAKYKYLMFLDADTFLPKHFLSKITGKINPEEDFVGIPLLLPLDGNLIDFLYVFVAYVIIVIVSFFTPIVTGMCLLTTKRNHAKIDGFNEKAVYAEDADYGFRSIKARTKYRLYLDCYLFSSVRRRREIGRLRLSLLWVRWYFDLVIHGAITDKAKYKYAFGNH